MDKISRKKILVTGGAGFIGSNFVHYWAKKYPNDEIVVLDKLTYAGSKQNLDGVLDKINFVEGDICEALVVEKAMQGCNVVVHFAAESHVDRSIIDPDIFIKTNVLGTQVLLNAAKKAGIEKFHHVSTDEVFGDLPLGSSEKWNEQTPYNPSSPYSASKAASDHLVRAYHRTFGLPVTISNCSNNIGPRMYPEKLLPLAITNLLAGKKVPIYGKGDQVREWLNVKDHCSAIDLILQKGKSGETYFVSPDNHEFNNLEVVRKLLVLLKLGDDKIEFVADRPGHDQRYAMDHSKITNELGWKPRFNLEDTLKEMVEWYKKASL
jgi:dTDP-glucose 4,6-dehydratase